jgi:hypothetical protein
MESIRKIIQNYGTESALDVKLEAMSGFNERYQLLKDAHAEIAKLESAIQDLKLQWEGTQKPPLKNMTTTGLRDAVKRLVDLL